MDAKEYFEKVVVPLVDELEGRPNDLAFIMAVAIATFHATDWIAAERNEDKPVVRERISERFPDFKYLRAVATAHKHMNVENPPEFKGLTDPLSKPSVVIAVDSVSGMPITGREHGALLMGKRPPTYKFADGVEYVPLELIRGSANAIALEFE
jgi:hypothetical protein